METGGQLTVFPPSMPRPLGNNRENGDRRVKVLTAYSTCSLGWTEGPPCYAAPPPTQFSRPALAVDFICLPRTDFSRSSLSQC